MVYYTLSIASTTIPQQIAVEVTQVPFCLSKSRSRFAPLILVLALATKFQAGTEPKREFSTPSQVYTFARQADHRHTAGATGESVYAAPSEDARRLAKTWCPVFPVEKQSGEDLYYLSLLCRDALAWHKAKLAVEHYLEGPAPTHVADARALLASLYTMQSQPERAWEILRVVLKQDPIQSHLCFMIDSLIEDEEDETKALDWSRERYSLLLKRVDDPNPDAKVSYQWVVLAGTNLVHRYYLSKKNDEAERVLEQLKRLKEVHSNEVGPWASEELDWANLEMRAAPSIPIQKLLSHKPVSEVIQKGRVEIISFFFLGCAPCIGELPALNDLQKRHDKSKVLVADVTTYEANSFPERTQSKIENALNKARRKKAPEVSVVVTSDQALAHYGIHAFPVIAVIDKFGRVRYMGRDMSFEEDDPVGRLVARLVTQ